MNGPFPSGSTVIGAFETADELLTIAVEVAEAEGTGVAVCVDDEAE